MTSILSKYYLYGSEKHPLDNHLMFIQILERSKLKEGTTRKIKQFEYLKTAIQDAVRSMSNKNIIYQIYSVKLDDSEKPMEIMIDTIRGFIE